VDYSKATSKKWGDPVEGAKGAAAGPKKGSAGGETSRPPKGPAVPAKELSAAEQEAKEQMAKLAQEADLLEAQAKHVQKSAKELEGTEEGDRLKEFAEAMFKKSAAKREDRRKLKPEGQLEQEKNRELDKRREQLTKAKQRLRTLKAEIEGLEGRLVKLRNDVQREEGFVQDFTGKIRQLNKELGRTPAGLAGGENDDADDDGSPSEDFEGPDTEMAKEEADLAGLRAACSSRRPRWDDELRDDYASVTSGGSGTKGGSATKPKRGAASGERSRSPPGRVGGLEPAF
jgi:hypothetical protein